jgi:hypothetical protein
LYEIELSYTDEERVAFTCVRRDGSSIVERAIEPAYELYYPNAEHCGACRTATAEVRLD